MRDYWQSVLVKVVVLHNGAVEVVRELRKNTTKPIVGVGGVYDHESAQAFLNAGANLVQLYTGFIYGGRLLFQKLIGRNWFIRRIKV